MGFIVDGWMVSYQRSREVQDLPPDVYCPAQRAFIHRSLRVGQATLAVNREDPSQFFGFIAFERDTSTLAAVVHYVYVKKTFRGMGIGGLLVDEVLAPLRRKPEGGATSEPNFEA